MQWLRVRVLHSDCLDLNLAPLLTSCDLEHLFVYFLTWKESSGFLTPIVVLFATMSCSLDCRASKELLVRRVALWLRNLSTRTSGTIK